MDKIVRIPVRGESSAPEGAKPPETRTGSLVSARYEEDRSVPEEESLVAVETPVSRRGPGREPEVEGRVEPEAEAEWRDLALRLQAEMDNYRKRQQRLAEEQIRAAREELLRSFLPIVDNLERALAASGGKESGLREGVQLTHREMLQRLRQEGVERIQALNRPFDPNWHEAVSAVPHDGSGIAPGTVLKVVEPGYRLGDRLLRPARVIVAI
jgi:molecular chaperone GrpE